MLYNFEHAHMKNTILVSIVLLVLTACNSTKNSINNSLVLGAVRGPFYLPHSYAISSDGTELRVDLPFISSSQAEWSNDHRWIALATDDPNKSEIIIIDLVRNTRIPLTDYQNGESYTPSWSPDGNRIAYFSYDANSDQDGIYIADISCFLENIKCSPRTNFIASGYSPSWSPDGRRIVFETPDHQIAIIEIDHVDHRTILSDRSCRDPKWSPTEEKIVVSCFVDNNIDIFLVDINTSSFTNLTKGERTNTKPIWSPDGQKIVFVSDRDTKGTMLGFDDTVRSNSVYIMNSDGSNIKRITTRNNENVRWLTWIYP